MKFPEQAREGSEGHGDAVRRLEQAREDQHDRQDALEDAKGTSSEPAAVTDLEAAREKTAAREAWLVWVERGF